MSSVTKWANVAVAMQSVIAAAKTITAVTQASPAVASSVAHGFTNGDYVLIAAQGMTQIDKRVFRVANVAADTFELEGIDSTSFDAFTSGDAKEITLGTSLTTLTSVSGSGGDFDFIDTTTIHDSIKTQIPGTANALTYEFESIWDVADTGLIALKLASDNQEERAFLFTFPNGQKMVFNGFVGASLVPGGNAQDKVTTSVTITAFGTPTYLAT